MLSQGRKRLIGLGAVVLGVLVIALGATRPDPFRDTTTYYAEFDSAQGLGAIGRDVRYAGVNVGTIGEVERSGDNAIVALELDREIPIHSDARANMRPHTLFEGSSFIDLHPGSPSAPLIEPGSTIPIEQTNNYITLDEALRILRPEIRRSLKQLAEVGSKTLRGGAIEGIQKTLRNGPELTRRTAGPMRALQGTHRRELRRAIEGMADTVEAVAQREDELIPLNRRLARTAAALTVDGGAPLDATLAALPGALEQLNEGGPTLNLLVDQLNRLAIEINPAVPDLTLALRDATPLLERSIPLLRSTTPVLANLRKIGARTAAAAPTLAKLVRTVDPVTDTFGGSVLPTLLEDSRVGEPTYEQLLATFTAANAVFRPYQTDLQNPLGSGHFWQIGTYGDDGTVFSGGLPVRASCAQIATIDRAAAHGMREGGRCR